MPSIDVILKELARERRRQREKNKLKPTELDDEHIVPTEAQIQPILKLRASKKLMNRSANTQVLVALIMFTFCLFLFIGNSVNLTISFLGCFLSAAFLILAPQVRELQPVIFEANQHGIESKYLIKWEDIDSITIGIPSFFIVKNGKKISLDIRDDDLRRLGEWLDFQRPKNVKITIDGKTARL